MAKSGMQMMIESMIGPELQKTMEQLPVLADTLANKVNAMDSKLDRILKLLVVEPTRFELPDYNPPDDSKLVINTRK